MLGRSLQDLQRLLQRCYIQRRYGEDHIRLPFFIDGRLLPRLLAYTVTRKRKYVIRYAWTSHDTSWQEGILIILADTLVKAQDQIDIYKTFLPSSSYTAFTYMSRWLRYNAYYRGSAGSIFRAHVRASPGKGSYAVDSPCYRKLYHTMAMAAAARR